MLRNQTENRKNSGFTLVEIMVVILIISILVALGNYGDFSQRRERARLEEITVQLTAMMDQEKTSSLLGKTESGAIVRKRKIELDFTDDILTYKSYADLAEDIEDSYCGTPGNNEVCPTPPGGDNVPLITKSWAPLGLTASVWNCDNDELATDSTSLTIELQGDTMSFLYGNVSIKHSVIQLSRQGSYREIHIDRRTGVIYERESVIANPLIPTPSCT